MSQENASLGRPFPFTFEGQSLPIGVCTGDVELHFTSWLELHARDKLARRKEELRDEYAWYVNLWLQKVETEEYEWTGYISTRIRKTEAGKKALLLLMMQSAGALVSAELIDRIFQCPEKVDELFNDDVVLDENKQPLPAAGLYWKSIAQGRPTVPVPNKAEPAATSK